MEHRSVVISIVWSQAPSTGAGPGTWQVVGAFGEETLESSTRPGDR
jgi:hypothetical protein